MEKGNLLSFDEQIEYLLNEENDNNLSSPQLSLPKKE